MTTLVNPAGRVEVSGELTRLLLLIDDAAVPIGSRQLVGQLAEQGLRWSEATMARRLRDLDVRGLTEKVGSKGRVPTASGRDVASAVRRGELSAERLRRASTIRTGQDVLNLLRARRAIEPEGVRGATERFGEHPEPVLGELVQQHRSATGTDGPVPRNLAMAFHRQLAQLSPNPIVRAMLDTVLSEDMDAVEAILDVVLEARHHAADSVAEHEQILAAMTTGQQSRAAELMYGHLNRLVSEVVAFLAENDARLIDRMLDLSTRR